MTGEAVRIDETSRAELPRNTVVDLVIVFAAALVFYWITLAPTIVWGDSAWLTWAIFKHRAAFGTAGDHPLFLWLGQLFIALPGDTARNINFEAAVFGAATVALVYRCARQLAASPLAALIGAGALAVSHVFWLHSVIAEVYTVNAFFVALTLSLLLDWRLRPRGGVLAAAAVVFAVGLSNHLVLATMAPAIAACLVLRDPRRLLSRRLLAAIALCALAGIVLVALFWTTMQPAIVKLWVGPPGIRDYLQPRIDVAAMAREAAWYVLFFTYQFPSLALVFGVAGLFALLRRDRVAGSLLVLTIAANAAVFIHHTDWQSAATSKIVFYLTDYVVFAIGCALGADRWLRVVDTRWPEQARHVSLATVVVVLMLPPAVYGTVPTVVSRLGWDPVGAKRLPYRDNVRFFLNPNKHGEDGARRFAEEAMAAMPAGGVLFADFTPYAVMLYLQEAEHVRPDIVLRSARRVSDRVPVRWEFDGERRRPAFVATSSHDYYDFSALNGSYDLVPTGPIFELRPRAAP